MLWSRAWVESMARDKQPVLMLAEEFVEQLKGKCSYLALAKCPEVRSHADDVVESRVGALVNQKGT